MNIIKKISNIIIKILMIMNLLKPTIKTILFFISLNFIVFSYVDICAPLLAKIVYYNETQLRTF